MPDDVHADFHENRREGEKRAESDEPSGAAEGEHGPVAKVTSRDAGAKRDSFFRKRDYE